MSANYVLAITGGSGSVYALRLLEVMRAAGVGVHLSISTAGAAVLEQELGLRIDLERFEPRSLFPPVDALGDDEKSLLLREVLEDAGAAGQGGFDSIRYYHHRDLLSPIASGSSLTAGMVICPCSGGTMSAIAHGASTNLIHRAADVHLKERRKLILVPRETPLSAIQLENMRRCAEAGAVVLPAMPGWYHGVRRLRDLIDFVVSRVCDQLGIENQLIRRWGQE